MTHKEFKSAARVHQIDFKENDSEINVPADSSPIRIIRRIDKDGKITERRVEVRSSLRWRDAKDENGDFVIFFSGFRREITRLIESGGMRNTGQMVTNLLRSEHIPYNLFYPMRHDLPGTASLFNKILGSDRIASVEELKIEYNPGGLLDGTAFDVYIAYVNHYGQKDGIGIEVKYTEKEYPIKRGSKEWMETHNAAGIHLADNYRGPSFDSGWYRKEYIEDVPSGAKNRSEHHVTADRFRQIWRNHLLGASMILGLGGEKLSEFTSLTVYPADNGHFAGIWPEYEAMLTTTGLETFRHLTYEELFLLMRECLDPGRIPLLGEWMDYLERRYIIPPKDSK